MTVYDTTELFRTGPRKFHAAWAETNGHKVSVPPTVARELAPNGMPGTDGQSVSYAVFCRRGCWRRRYSTRQGPSDTLLVGPLDRRTR